MQDLVLLKPFCKADFSFVLELSEQLLGVDYITIKVLQSYLDAQSGIVAWKEQQPLGVLFWNSLLPQNLIKRYENEDAIYLQTIIINPEFQKQGVGLKLITDFTNSFKDKLIIAQAWSVNGHCNAESLNLKVGFKKIKTEGKIWKSDCEAQKFICPSYDGTCNCEAILFEKN